MTRMTTRFCKATMPSRNSRIDIPFAMILFLCGITPLFVSADAAETFQHRSSKSSFQATTTTTSKRRNLIVNGDTAKPSDYQFFARSSPDTELSTADLLCGASLIHSDILLTAAHCQGAFNYGAILYNPDTQAFDRFGIVDKQVPHPEYFSDVSSKIRITIH